MDLQLSGRRALVTGSSSGIGTGIARALAAEGAAVVIHGRDVDRTRAVTAELVADGARAVAVTGSLSDDESAARVATEALAAFDGIDVLVNNAGGSAETVDPSWFMAGSDTWLATFEANPLAAVRLIRHLVPAMRERGWGRVINIATGAAITPTSAQPDYAASKAAMLNLTLSLSKALKRTGVTSNAVSPGMIRTQGLERFLTGFAAKRGWGDDLSRAEQYVLDGSGQTVGRVGEVDDVAYAVCMLAGPRADFLNGVDLHVDGGASPSMY